MTSGDDSRTVNHRLALGEMEVDSFNSVLIPLVKSASVRGNLIQLSLERQNPGALEFIRMKEVPPDGRIAGGWRSVDNTRRDNGEIAQGCLVVAGLGLVVSLTFLCWVVIFRLLFLI